MNPQPRHVPWPDQESNQWPFTLWNNTQPTEPYHSGPIISTFVCTVPFELHYHLARKASVPILQRTEVRPGEDVVKGADGCLSLFLVCGLLHSPRPLLCTYPRVIHASSLCKCHLIWKANISLFVERKIGHVWLCETLSHNPPLTSLTLPIPESKTEQVKAQKGMFCSPHYQSTNYCVLSWTRESPFGFSELESLTQLKNNKTLFYHT